MKKILALLGALLLSCGGAEQRSGLNSSFVPSSTGTTYLGVEDEKETIHFSSTVELDAGEITIFVVNPRKDTVFVKRYWKPDEYQESTEFSPLGGTWQAGYISKNGNGYIELELYY